MQKLPIIIIHKIFSNHLSLDKNTPRGYNPIGDIDKNPPNTETDEKKSYYFYKKRTQYLKKVKSHPVNNTG